MDIRDQGFEEQNLEPEIRLPYFLPIRFRNIEVAVFIFGAAFFLLGVLVDWLLIHARVVSQIVAAAILDGIFAVIFSVLVYKLLSYDRERRRKVLERLQTIEQMNHHIRNALQVISFNAHERTDTAGLTEINKAMERIQWALREILPKVEPAFDSFEGSARESGDARFKSAGSDPR